MIPDKFHITNETIQYFLLNESTNFFVKANEFVVLQEKFIKESLLEKLSLWFSLFISPLLTLFNLIIKKEDPSIFTMLSIKNTFDLWCEYIKFHLLSKEIHEWTKIVRSVNGPFISCNDPTYHMFVYADAMERLRIYLKSRRKSTIFTRFTKKCTKSF
jgi:hypothetical protein